MINQALITCREYLSTAQEDFVEQERKITELTGKVSGRRANRLSETLSLTQLQRKFSQVKDAWLRIMLLRAMYEALTQSGIREKFTFTKILKLAGDSLPDNPLINSIERHKFNRLVGAQWRSLAKNLPTKHQIFETPARNIALGFLEDLVEARIPVQELTADLVLKRTKSYLPREFWNCVRPDEWLWKPLRAQRLVLTRRLNAEPQETLTGSRIRAFPGGSICLDDHEWNLCFAKGNIIKHDQLRQDFADLAWSLLREELHAGELAAGTICGHHHAFVLAGELLGTEVPDVRVATLESVQRAWHKYGGTLNPRRQARYGLTRLFSHLSHEDETDPSINSQEMLRISTWIIAGLKVPNSSPNEDFLSTAEMDQLIARCLTDIDRGTSFIASHPDWVTMSVRPDKQVNASEVVRWSIALMILLMAVTGLRKQSVAEIELGDWLEIHSGVFALAWHHDKRGQEEVVVVPTQMINFLQQYVTLTEPLRRELDTHRVFLTGDQYGNWCVFRHTINISEKLKEFTKRHRVERNGEPLALTPTTLRRTYATRLLYEGRRLGEIRLQLGHASEETTMRYVKFDRYEYPARVREALDRFGRLSLTTWHHPVLLEVLESHERAEILADSQSRDQNVGLCRHSSCVQIERGGPPPCSLCKHLVTGPKFLPAFQSEHAARLSEIRRLSASPTSGHLLANAEYQLRRFEEHLAYLQERSGA